MTAIIHDKKQPSSSHTKMMMAVVFILLLAWFLQLHQLQTNSLLGDEVASYNRASLSTWSDVSQEYAKSGHTPLYEWMILHNWLKLVGGGNLLSRIPTVLISSLMLALTYTLGTRVTTRKVAATAVFFITISPLFLQFAREVRPYLLMSLTSMLALYMWLRALQTEQWKYWIGFTIGGGLMVYTHYYQTIVLIAIGLVTVVYIWRTKSTHLLRPFSIATFVIVLLFLPWMPIFLAAYAYGDINWIGPLTRVQVYFLPTTFINHMTAPQRTSAGSGSLMIALIFWILWTMAKSPPKWLLRLISISFLMIGLAIFISIAIKPMFIPRYFMGVAPIFALMLSWGLWYLQPKWVVGMVYGLVFILMLSGTRQLATLQRAPSWTDAATYLQENAEPSDLVLIVSSETWTPQSFYHHCQTCEMPIINVLGSLDNKEQVETWIQEYNQYDRIWFIQEASSRAIRTAASLQPERTYSGYTLQERKLFDQDLISASMGLDLWLLSTK